MLVPQFFVDRSLGWVRLPNLLRADGWSLVTMAEHYGEVASQGVIDVDWLQTAGANNWPALMKDEKIRYRPAERAAIIEHGVRGFYLTSGNLTSLEMAEAFIVNRDAIWAYSVEPGPGLFAVSRSTVRRIALHD